MPDDIAKPMGIVGTASKCVGAGVGKMAAFGKRIGGCAYKSAATVGGLLRRPLIWRPADPVVATVAAPVSVASVVTRQQDRARRQAEEGQERLSELQAKKQSLATDLEKLRAQAEDRKARAAEAKREQAQRAAVRLAKRSATRVTNDDIDGAYFADQIDKILFASALADLTSPDEATRLGGAGASLLSCDS